MVSSSSAGKASKMSIVRRRSVTRMLAVAPGRPIGGGQVWFTDNNATRDQEVPGGCEDVSIQLPAVSRQRCLSPNEGCLSSRETLPIRVGSNGLGTPHWAKPLTA